MMVNWSALSPEAKETTRLLAIPISQGYSQREACQMAGWTARQAGARLRSLREEIRHLETTDEGEQHEGL